MKLLEEHETAEKERQKRKNTERYKIAKQARQKKEALLAKKLLDKRVTPRNKRTTPRNSPHIQATKVTHPGDK